MRMTRYRQTGLLGGLAPVIALALSGCNSFDAKPSESKEHLVVPVDERPAVSSTRPMPAISGGTLAVLTDGSAAIVSDPIRDTISIVDLNSLAVALVVLRATS